MERRHPSKEVSRVCRVLYLHPVKKEGSPRGVDQNPFDFRSGLMYKNFGRACILGSGYSMLAVEVFHAYN